MFASRYSLFVKIALFAVFVGCTLANLNAQPDQRALTIWKYFSSLGFEVDFDNHSFVAKYGDDVIERMNFCLDQTDTARQYVINTEINYLIYENELKEKLDEEKCKPFKPDDEVLLRAIDLIVPNSGADVEYQLAKEDLRKFYLEQRESAIELLDRIRAPLGAEELHTDEAATYLKHFYNRWIPLGRLRDFIETKGTQQD